MFESVKSVFMGPEKLITIQDDAVDFINSYEIGKPIPKKYKALTKFNLWCFIFRLIQPNDITIRHYNYKSMLAKSKNARAKYMSIVNDQLDKIF